MAAAFEYTRAFQKNCPSVRMTREEEYELDRLFAVCKADGRAQALRPSPPPQPESED